MEQSNGDVEGILQIWASAHLEFDSGPRILDHSDGSGGHGYQPSECYFEDPTTIFSIRSFKEGSFSSPLDQARIFGDLSVGVDDGSFWSSTFASAETMDKDSLGRGSRRENLHLRMVRSGIVSHLDFSNMEDPDVLTAVDIQANCCSEIKGCSRKEVSIFSGGSGHVSCHSLHSSYFTFYCGLRKISLNLCDSSEESWAIQNHLMVWSFDNLVKIELGIWSSSLDSDGLLAGSRSFLGLSEVVGKFLGGHQSPNFSRKQLVSRAVVVVAAPDSSRQVGLALPKNKVILQNYSSDSEEVYDCFKQWEDPSEEAGDFFVNHTLGVSKKLGLIYAGPEEEFRSEIMAAELRESEGSGQPVNCPKESARKRARELHRLKSDINYDAVVNGNGSLPKSVGRKKSVRRGRKTRNIGDL
ncbi:uncharacterized protein LOC143858305 [Tasmannia lanceolata]|uniref:uncharacterized protein LOC143858305 n=1 Tax=Tasmannia lanceolata TaxID=3420 RepID=UPI0040629590